MEITNKWVKLDSTSVSIQNSSGYNKPVYIAYESEEPTETSEKLELKNKQIVNCSIPFSEGKFIYVKSGSEIGRVNVLPYFP